MLQNVQYQPTPQKSLNQIRGVYCTRTQYSPAGFVAHAGISVYIDSKHKITHNKITL